MSTKEQEVPPVAAASLRDRLLASATVAENERWPTIVKRFEERLERDMITHADRGTTAIQPSAVIDRHLWEDADLKRLASHFRQTGLEVEVEYEYRWLFCGRETYYSDLVLTWNS